MDHMKILKRAWRILWSYKALWVFGIIVAITTSSGNANSSAQGGGGGGNNNDFNFTPPPGIEQELEEFGEFLGEFFGGLFAGAPGRGIPGGLIALFVGLACLAVILAVVFTIARYVSYNALILMVNDYEETGEKKTVGRGFKMGWSRPAWRFFLIDLVIMIPVIVVAVLLIALALAPLLLWITEVNVLGIFGTIATIGLFLLVILFLIIVAVVVTLLSRFARRAAALEDLGVFDAIGRGFEVVRENLGAVGMMWLILVGVRIGQAIVSIPVVLLSVVAGLLFGGLFLLLGRGIAGLFSQGAVPWIIGMVVGAPAFILSFVIPLGFVGGLFETFVSTVWTLTYRELELAPTSPVLDAPEAAPPAGEVLGQVE